MKHAMLEFYYAVVGFPRRLSPSVFAHRAVYSAWHSYKFLFDLPFCNRGATVNSCISTIL